LGAELADEIPLGPILQVVELAPPPPNPMDFSSVDGGCGKAPAR
jgi:hypothetical protein